MNLSKSKYVRGLQCPKMLWMERNMPDEFDRSVMNEAVLEGGSLIGDLAMGYFGEFSEVPYTGHTSDMIAETKRLLEAGTETIAEASFAYKENFCSVDILRVNGDGSFDFVEVKGSTVSDDDAVREKKILQYLDDMAYQYYVITNAGYKVNRVFLMLLNSRYVRHGDLDISKLFALNDATDFVLAAQQDIPANIAAINAVADQTGEPGELIGSRCDKPFECGYKQYCWKDMPENNIYNIGFSMRSSKKDDNYLNGIVTFEDAAREGLKLTVAQQRQVDTALHDLPPHIDKEGIREFLDTLSYPLYFLDFETISQPIPPWDNVWPYMQLPFQYSLHILDEPGGIPVHKEFLAKEGTDPRRALAESLCADIPEDVCTLVYYEPFEKGQLTILANTFPDLADHIMNILAGIKDLIVPFSKGLYYNKAMGGSASIKSVLPALFPDDPELDYNALSLVHHGAEAMNIFPTLHEKPPEEIADLRAALLAYCRLDTLAMVRILEKLYTLVD